MWTAAWLLLHNSMKINELYSAVAKLGFESSLEDISAFYSAANRAMLQINALRPLTAILEIYHRECKNLIVGATHDIYFRTHSDVIFECPGGAKAFYFEANGVGGCNIEVYDSAASKWEPVNFVEFDSRAFEAHRGFIEPDEELADAPVRLRFIGKYAYQIRNAALYDVLYSGNVEDIPAYEEYVRYDLRRLADGFIELADNPFVSSFTRITDDYVFESGSVLLLPPDVAREVKIKYKKRPATLVYKDDPEKDDSEIELDPELAELLPLLTAVYVWADEGDGKSQYYYQLYLQRAQEIEARKRSREPATYSSVNGW